jgi:hypothetical protein
MLSFLPLASREPARRRWVAPSNRGSLPWGRVFLWVLLLCHMFAFQGACDSQPGTEGGPCEQDACGGTCDSGLTCDVQSNTCVPAGAGCGSLSSSNSQTTTPQDNGCTNASLDQCPAGQLAYECAGGAVPYASDPATCTQGEVTDQGTLFCCPNPYLAPPVTLPPITEGPAPPAAACCFEGGSDADRAGDRDQVDGAASEPSAADALGAPLADAPAAE